MCRGIDGLASVISDTCNLDLFDDALFLFAVEKRIVFKFYIGIKMFLGYFVLNNYLIGISLEYLIY
ncbi:hypothetical protein GCM10011482_10840 [Enterococcus alcedinis]|uniref:Uncharacterized protein n=2 Tax=Enterococcus alcedinis TaxID=1274384 RepID=A0A917JGK9_9ENTE|nr:hypothetical protein [Enterococcus alcedinis]GGI65430.1 hypothetical protein GCM10011482_10840 [Enterococcus alcedinis]